MKTGKPLFLALSLFLAALAPAWAEDLTAIYKLAEKNDQVYQAALASYRADKQSRPLALAPLLPSISVSAQSGLNRFDPLDPPPEGVGHSPQDYDNQRLSITLSQVVFDYAKLTQARQSSRKVLEAEAQLAEDKQELMLRVSQLYFQVLEAAEALASVGAEKAALAQSLDQAKRAAAAGVISPTEADLAKAKHDMVVAREIAAANHLQASREELAEIIGRAPGSLAGLPLAIPLSPPSPADPQRWTDTALNNNQGLKALAQAVQGAKLQVTREMAGHAPTLNLVASHGYSDVGGGRVSGTDVSTSVALELRLPIFEGGRVGAQVRQAHYLFQRAKAKHLAQKRKVIRLARNAYREVEVARARIGALKQAVASSTTAAEGAAQRLKVGASSLVEYLEAVSDRFKAVNDLTQARYRYLLARLRLRRAAGALSQNDLENISRLLTVQGAAAPKG